MTQRPPLWTPEEARAEAEREGEPEETSCQKLAGCLVDGCMFDGCLALAPLGCLLVGLFYLIR